MRQYAPLAIALVVAAGVLLFAFSEQDADCTDGRCRPKKIDPPAPLLPRPRPKKPWGEFEAPVGAQDLRAEKLAPWQLGGVMAEKLGGAERMTVGGRPARADCLCPLGGPCRCGDDCRCPR